ncbi:hypothetical protein LZK98_09350 [Sphingomonas cannabina]|uniref:hypothetical protein n=1 Tax=Sphingomonas cannabina TaxID=2899123 RepID=UPI001F23D1A5|nr:hypothetical protein [Sphingomonas cannabina]UIJ47125.1 hypothetical protein LZK98_09350 [Sphingomonas cannabina]
MADDREPNPFGYADHSPFSAFGAELVYGQRSDGTLVHVSQVSSGLACDCVCPACGRALIARKGAIKVEHFGHYGAGSGCGRNAETNAHSWAKAVLEREKRVLLPAVGARIGKDKLQTHKERMFPFARVQLEKTLDDIVPDVVLTTEDGQQLLVEVLVTHACGPEKIAKLRDRGLATVEINMSAWRKSSDRQAIEDALIEWAPREWLFNRKLVDAEARLQALLEQRAAEQAKAERLREQRAAAEKRAREDRLRQDLADKVASVRGTIVSARRSGSSAGAEELREVKRDMLFSAMLLPNQRTAGFLVSNEHWQAALIGRIVKVPIGEGFFLPSFGLDTVVRALEDCIPALFRRELPDDVRLALRTELHDRRLPRQAVEDYLYFLCDQGMLQSTGLGSFEVHKDRARALEAQHAQWQARRRRRSAIDRSMEKILQAIPAEERKRFSAGLWQKRRIPGFDRTLDALVDAEEETWSRFDRALLAIERMVDGGEAVSETLGLPLEGELARARERARQKAAQEADDRERTLRIAAGDALGTEAETWLYTPPDADSPVVLARNSQAGLSAALAALEEERKQFAKRVAAAALAADCRRLLKTDAEKDLGAALTGAFLNNYDARLNATPWNICIDQAGLRLARIELANWVERNKRTRRR